MSSEDTLILLLGLIEKEQKTALAELGAAFQRLDRENTQASALKGFLNEYQGRLKQESQQGLTVQSLTNFHAFLEKIDTAILHQGQEVALARAALASIRERFKAISDRAKAFEILIEARQQAKKKTAQQQEQAETDAFALHRYHRPGH